MRIGIIGTENSHVDHIVEHLNVAQHGAGARVVAVSGGPSERNEKLRAAGDLERIVEHPTELLDHVDAVVVTDRHGGLHRANATPFLEAGLPVFVDKPLACTVADAEALVATALANDAPLTSYSALRWVPDTDALAAAGPPRQVRAGGPVDPGSPHGGIFFYGIHPVDVALRLARGAIGDVTIDQGNGRIAVSAQVGDTAVAIDLVLPGTEAPFTGSVSGPRGTVEKAITLGPHYFVPGLEAFLTMARTRRIPIAHDDLIRPIHLLETVVRGLA